MGGTFARTGLPAAVASATYDAANRVATRIDPLARSETFTYDANGRRSSWTDRKGQVTTYTYDGLDRPTVVGFGATGSPPTRYDEIIEWAARTLKLDPAHLLAREFMAAAYLKKGDADRCLAESLAHARTAGAPADLIDDLQRVYDAGGPPGIVDYAIRLNAGGPPMQLALLHGEAGRLDDAFQYLDAAIALHDPALVHLAVGPQWDCLRDDPRFEERLIRLGLRTGDPNRPG